MVKHMEWPIGIEKLNRFQTRSPIRISGLRKKIERAWPDNQALFVLIFDLMVWKGDKKKTVDGIANHLADTDGIIDHLWPEGAAIPDGTVGIPQSRGHWEALHAKIAE